VHRNNILIYVQQDSTLQSLFYLEIVLLVSGGTSTHHQERISRASGICQTVTATCHVFGHESNKQSLNSGRQEGDIHFEESLLTTDSHFIT